MSSYLNLGSETIQNKKTKHLPNRKKVYILQVMGTAQLQFNFNIKKNLHILHVNTLEKDLIDPCIAKHPVCHQCFLKKKGIL